MLIIKNVPRKIGGNEFIARYGFKWNSKSKHWYNVDNGKRYFFSKILEKFPKAELIQV